MRNGFDPVLKYNYDIYFKYNNYTPSMNCKKLVILQSDSLIFIKVLMSKILQCRYIR